MPDGPYTQLQQPTNPFDMIGKVATAANAIQQNILMRKSMAAQQATGQAILGHVGPDGVVDTNRLMSDASNSNDPNLAYGAQALSEYAQTQRQNRQTLAQNQFTYNMQHYTAIRQALSPLAEKKDLTFKDFANVGADLINADPSAFTAKLIANELAQIKRLNPSDNPDQNREIAVHYRDQAMTAENQLAAHHNVQYQNVGGQQVPVNMAPEADTPQPVLQNTATPDTLAHPATYTGADGVDRQTTIGGYNSITQGGTQPIKGPPPGFVAGKVAAATTAGTGTAQDALAFENGARSLPALKATLANMSGDLQDFIPGPGSAKRGGIMAAINSFMGTGYDAERVASQEGMDKLHADLAAKVRQAAGLPSTDQSASIMDHAVPGSQLSKLGNQNQIAILKGTVDYGQVANQAWERYKASGNGHETFHQFTTELNKRVDPLVFQMQYMKPNQRNAITSAMSPAELKRLEQSNAYARKYGLVK